MSAISKMIQLETNVLLEYTFDDTNYVSEDYQILTNLMENSKSYMSSTGINTSVNSLFMVDPVLQKYSPINTSYFNFLRIQDYFTAPVLYDTITLYFPSGFDFYTDFLGFYFNAYVFGYNNNTQYSLTNFYYVKSNTSPLDIFDLPEPFYFNGKTWVRSITFNVPSANSVSGQRVVYNTLNNPVPDSINTNLTFGEGLAQNSPIYFDFAYIESTQTVLTIPYYYITNFYSASIPQSPEFTSLGIYIGESSQWDYFEIYATYLGSNENMTQFAYNELLKGINVNLEYIISVYEENILTTSETILVTDNFTQILVWRPVIQFSNTTAVIQVELRVVNTVDNSYVSVFGSLGIRNSLHKYGKKLTQLNLSSGVMNPNIYNLKVNNIINVSGLTDTLITNTNTPYPVMVDKYRILTKSNNSSLSTNSYVPNGLLQILITPFDNVIQFNIAQDINSTGDPIPYDLSAISVNSQLLLTFKSDTDTLSKQILYTANNVYSLGQVTFQINQSDLVVLRRIYNKGYTNFYLVVSTNTTTTQLYSGKYVFYEDVVFVNPATTSSSGNTSSASGTTSSNPTSTTSYDTSVVNTNTIDQPVSKVDQNIIASNQFVQSNMQPYTQDTTVNKNYNSVMVYVRFQVNLDQMNAYLKSSGITADIQYGNIYYFYRMYVTVSTAIQALPFVEKVFIIPLNAGLAPVTASTNTTVLKTNNS